MPDDQNTSKLLREIERQLALSNSYLGEITKHLVVIAEQQKVVADERLPAIIRLITRAVSQDPHSLQQPGRLPG